MSENKIIGIFGLIITAMYGFAIPGVKNPSPTFLSGTTIFPILVAIGTFVFSAAFFVMDFKEKGKAKKYTPDKKVMKTIGVYLLIFIIYSIIFESVGFILSTLFMLFGILTVLNKGKLKVNLIISIVFPVIAYAVFAKGFAISLPPGIIYF